MMFFAFLLFFNCLFPRFVPTEQRLIVDLYVGSSAASDTQDSVNPASCDPSSSSAALCNLRSAFGYCVENVFSTSPSTCAIHMYNGLPVSFNTSLGSLFYSPTTTGTDNLLYIYGNNSRITPSTSSASGRFLQFMNASLAVENLLFEGFQTPDGDGGVMQLSNSTITLQNVTFENNSAVNGGALCVSIHSNVSIMDSYFSTNKANEYGGAVFARERNEVQIINGFFYDNEAAIGGGSVSIFTNNDNVIIKDSVFSNNRAISYYVNTTLASTYGGGALFIYMYNNFLTLRNNQFLGNMANYYNSTYVSFTAGLGGAVNIVRHNNYATVENCYFLNNVALFGGGLLLDSENDHLKVVFSTFISNRAYEDQANLVGGEAGAIEVHRQNDGFTIDSCVFRDNNASFAGGAVKLGINNTQARIVNSSFAYNSLSTRGYGGAGVYLFKYNTNTTVDNCTILRNVAPVGAGLYISRYSNGVHVTNSVFDSNAAMTSGGGAVWIRYGNSDINFYGCNFTNNTSGGGEGGGAINMFENNTNIMIQRSIFKDNEASTSSNDGIGGGGAITIYESNSYVTLLDLLIQGNIGYPYGGGILIAKSNTYVTIAGSELSDNHALDGGGYYLHQYNDNFVIVSTDVFTDTSVVETSHPYSSILPIDKTPQVILNKTISIDHAEELTIVFDPQSALTGDDVLTIWTNSSQIEQLYYTNGNGRSFPGVGVPPLRFKRNSIFILFTGPTENIFTDTKDYGFKLTVYPSGTYYSSNGDSMVRNNDAEGAGGGGMLYFLNDASVCIATVFEGNTAYGGGGMYVQAVNAGPFISSSTFDHNHAVSGGAISFSSSNYGTSIWETSISHNTADLQGGGLEFDSGNGVGIYDIKVENIINISSCILYNNSALQGGAFAIGGKNVLAMFNMTIIENKAIEHGGGIAAESQNRIEIKDSTFDGNIAGSLLGYGGGLVVFETNTIEITDTDFTGNIAFLGGAMALLNNTNITFNGLLRFSVNKAVVGAGISLRSAPLWQMSEGANLKFVSNEAKLGSAIALANIDPLSEPLNNLTIEKNIATQGGTIYWVYGRNNLSVEPAGLNSPSITWRGNKALYGVKYATQAVSIRSPGPYLVGTYDTALTPPVVANLFDYYDTRILSDNVSTSVLRACTDSDCPHECGDGNRLYLGGQISTKSQNGSLAWNTLFASCYPTGYFTALFTGEVEDPSYFGLISLQDYLPSGEIIFDFRDCVSGEYYEYSGTQACQPCPYGSYSYSYVPNKACSSCPSEANLCQKNETDLKTGYWRQSGYSTTILKCPYNTCDGGTGSSDDLCSAGSTGPLCAVCLGHYYFNSQTQKCQRCQSISYISPMLIAIFVIVSLCIVVISYITFKKNISRKAFREQIEESGVEMHVEGQDATPTEEDSTRGSINAKIEWYDILYAYLAIRFRDLAANFKIIVATLQILMSVPSNFLIEFPTSYSGFLSIFEILNINIVRLTSWECVNNGLDYVDRLIIITMTPFAILGILFVCFVVQGLYVKTNTVHEEDSNSEAQGRPSTAAGLLLKALGQIERLRYLYVSIFLIITFLILPSVTTVIFGMFSCQNINPSGESNGNEYGEYYLRRDYSIECNGDRFYFGVIWASIMIIIYPCGLPLLNFWLLYKHRNYIMHRFDPEDTGEENRDFTTSISSLRKLPDDTRMIEFLYRSYLPRYWYFESIETFRRLFLTAFISVIVPGSSVQLIIALFVALFFLLTYIRVRPYLEYGTSFLSQYALVLIFVTYVGATFVGGGLLSNESTIVVTSLLVTGTVLMIALALAYEMNNYRGFLAYRRMYDSNEETQAHVHGETATDENYEKFVATNTQRTSARLNLDRLSFNPPIAPQHKQTRTDRDLEATKNPMVSSTNN